MGVGAPTPHGRLKSALLPCPLLTTLGLYWSICPVAQPPATMQLLSVPTIPPELLLQAQGHPQVTKPGTLSSPPRPSLLLEATTWETRLPSGRFSLPLRCLSFWLSPHPTGSTSSAFCVQLSPLLGLWELVTPWLRSGHFSLTFPFLSHND